jgi:hypothetical protein
VAALVHTFVLPNKFYIRFHRRLIDLKKSVIIFSAQKAEELAEVIAKVSGN